MADDFFKVRNGFIVGEDIFTVDGTTGDVEVTGDLKLKGSTSGTVSLTAPAVAGTQAYTLPTALPASNGYVLASQTDGTMSWIANDTNTTYTQNFTSTSGGTNLNLVGSDSTTDTVKFANGTGVTVTRTDADTATIAIGQPVATTDNVQFNDITLTGNITDTGALQISTGANGAITLAPNGTGNTVITTNLVRGSVRQSGPIANGDVWGTGATGTSGTSRGISLDNTGNTAKRNSIVLRGYNNQRSSIIGEMASGSAASPAVPGAGFTIVEMAATGYNGGGADGWVSSQNNGYTGRAFFAASETWTSTSTGTNFIVGVNPTGYVGVFPQVLAMNPVNGQTNIDTFTFANKLPNVGGTAATQMTVTEALVSTAGDLKVGGNDIQASDGNTNITLTSNTLTAFAGDIKVGGNDIQASDGATNISMTSNTLTAVAGDLQVNGNDILASDGATNITLTSNTLTAVAGDLKVGGNDIQASDGTTALTLSATTGNVAVTGNLDVLGGTITESTGALTISTGAANGNITLDPNGTGNVVLTFANGGNLTNDRNYVSGIIRQTNVAAAGDIYGFNTGTTNPVRGISIDNTASATTTTGKRTGIVMRNYSNTPRNSIIGEAARGTNPSAPTILTNNNVITELVASGYTAASDGTGFQATGCTITGTTLTIGTVTSGSPAVGQLLTSVTQGAVVTTGTTITANISGSGSGSTWTVSTSQAVGSSTIWGGGDGWMSSVNGLAGAIRLQSFENWTNQTSGTGMIVSLSPLANAGTLALAGSSFNALSMSLSATTLASDSQTFRTRPAGAGGTNFAMLSLTESLATVGGDLRVNGNDIQNSAGSTNITMTNDRSITTVTSDIFRVDGASPSTNYFSVGKSFDGDVILAVNHTRATQGYENALINFQTQRSADGINYTPTQSGDTIGEFKFNGNAYTSTSPGVPGGPGASIQAQATETWSSTATGTKFEFQAVKTGTISNYSVIQGTPDEIKLNATTLDLNSFDGTTALVGNNINYNRVYGQWQNLNTVTPVASNTAYAFALPTVDYTNIASVASTSRIIPGAAGMYKLQFSAQVQNDDTADEHVAYFWWRKNGTDVPGSMGRVGIFKAKGAVNGLTIAGWDNMISSANTTDYWELMYAVDDHTHVTFPAFTTTAFGPATSSLFVTLVPIGA